MEKPKKAMKAKRQKLSCPTFEDLPNELFIGTFSYLNMKDLISCSQVSKRFWAIVVDEQGRRKDELLKSIQNLQCFKCKKVPGPDRRESEDKTKRSYCWGRRVCFKDVIDHFNKYHKKIWHQIDGESNKWTDLIKEDFSDHRSWYSGKMTSANGNVFAVFARVHR